MVRVHLRPHNWTHPEPHLVPVEQFLAMLRFEQRDKVADLVSEAELPIDLDRSGRDDFFSIPPVFPNNQIQSGS